MDQKIISVVGGGGFIGKYLVDKLLDQGYYVKIISRDPKSKKAFYPSAKLGQYSFLVAPQQISPTDWRAHELTTEITSPRPLLLQHVQIAPPLFGSRRQPHHRIPSPHQSLDRMSLATVRQLPRRLPAR